MTELRHTIVADACGVHLATSAIPSCGPTEVLIQVQYSLISPGTERHYIAQLSRGGGTLALGYCAVGVVLSIGDRVDHVAVGELVIAMGWTIATHSSHIVAPRRLVARVPAGVPASHALLATLGATAVHAADRAAIDSSDRVLVVGLGAVGMLVGLACSNRGCAVSAWDRDANARQAARFWDHLDPAVPASKASVSVAFLCVDGDLGALVELVRPALDPRGNGARRPRIVNVGRLSGHLTLAPAFDNIDIINSSRCGAGYRDDEYHHGEREVPVVRGEHTVDENLRRSLDVVAQSRSIIDGLALHVHTPREALERYNSTSFFPPGFHLIDHGGRS